MNFKNILFFSILSLSSAAKANSVAVIDFLREIEGQHALSGGESCEYLYLGVDRENSILSLEIGDRNLRLSDKLRHLSFEGSHAQSIIQGNELTLIVRNDYDDGFDSWFGGKSRVTVKIKKDNLKLIALIAVYEYKKFGGLVYRTVNKMDCK